MDLRPLFCQIALVFLQKCQARYNYYDYHGPDPGIFDKDDVHLPRYHNHFGNHDRPQTLLRRAHNSGSNSDSSSTEECVCDCNECYYNVIACCMKFCEMCRVTQSYPYNDGYIYNNVYQPPYQPMPENNVMAIQYAVPFYIYPFSTMNPPQKDDKTTIKPENTEKLYTTSTTVSVTSANKTTEHSKEKSTSTTVTPKTKPSDANPDTSDETKTDSNSFEETDPTDRPIEEKTYPEETEPTETSVEDFTPTTIPQPEKSPSKKDKLKTRTTRLLVPEPNSRLKKNTTDKVPPQKHTPHKSENKPSTITPEGNTNSYTANPKADFEYLSTSFEDNATIEYYDYPHELIKIKNNASKCKDAANCYTRDWNKDGDLGGPIKLYIETGSSLMPLVHLRPTLGKPIKKRLIAETPRYKIKPKSKDETLKYKLGALNDRFAKKLINQLKHKKVLVLQNNGQ